MKIQRILIISMMVTILVAWSAPAIAQKGQWQEYSLPTASQRGHKWETPSDRNGNWLIVISPGGANLLQVSYKVRGERDWKPLPSGDRDGRQWSLNSADAPFTMKVLNASGKEVKYKVSPSSIVVPVN